MRYTNDIFRAEKNTTPAYTSGSRDFQMLFRMLTFIIGSCRNSAEQLKYLNDPININNLLLSLLRTKVGFISNNDYSDSQIRDVIEGFKSLVRLKGTKQSINKAIELFFNALNMLGTKVVEIVNATPTEQQKANNFTESYTVYIVLSSKQEINDTTLLFDILSYVVPAGYMIDVKLNCI